MSLTEAARRRFAEDGGRVVRALYAKDPSLWVSAAAVRWLGWLDAPRVYGARAAELAAFADEVRGAGFTRVMLLGMGGSSLAPEVFFRTFGQRPGFPGLTVLDTTDPSAILDAAAAEDLARTFFLVSSKSGTTVETNALFAYFWERTGGRGGAQFAAITDPGTSLAALGRDRGFRRVFENAPEIGGRFSALSYFGLVPAALVGVDVAALTARAAAMADRCASGTGAPMEGAALGAYFAEAFAAGRDKLVIDGGPTFASFGVWAEQLVAESTGKNGKGLVPVVDEPPGAGAPDAPDRCPVSLAPGDPLDLGAAFYQWEVATAAAGAWMGVDPFDQPNVAESKANTDRVLKELAGGAAPEPAAGLEGLAGAVRGWAAGIGPGDYVALLAYLAPGAGHDGLLARLRRAIGGGRGVATTAGYGPRFLHSTGQLHKGGPPSGVFLQLETTDDRDAAIPGAGLTFGRLKLAQALGDHRALRARGRLVLRVRVREAELERVAEAVEEGVGG